MSVQYFFDGLDMERDTPPPYGMAEAASPLDPYLEFVSSPNGLVLNDSFLRIEDEATRQNLLSMIANIARTSQPKK